MMPTMQK